MTNCTSGYEDMDNVKEVMKVFTEDDFTTTFTSALDIYTYDNFLRAACKFPMFCGEISSHISGTTTLAEVCKLEVATIFAHMMYESSDFTLAADSSCSDGDGGSDCDYIRESAVAETEYPAVDGQQYYGRGVMMLKWSDGFGKFSDIAYDGGLNDRDILLASPGDVSTDGFWAFA